MRHRNLIFNQAYGGNCSRARRNLQDVRRSARECTQAPLLQQVPIQDVVLFPTSATVSVALVTTICPFQHEECFCAFTLPPPPTSASTFYFVLTPRPNNAQLPAFYPSVISPQVAPSSKNLSPRITIFSASPPPSPPSTSRNASTSSPKRTTQTSTRARKSTPPSFSRFPSPTPSSPTQTDAANMTGMSWAQDPRFRREVVSLGHAQLLV